MPTVLAAPNRKLLADKLRGGYYTPAAVAQWICNWAIRSTRDRVLEPSCGDGAFLAAASRRLVSLGASQGRAAKQIRGIELAKAEATKSTACLRSVLGGHGVGSVLREDFFSWVLASEDEPFDCAVGNPPFVRYQNFPEPSRTRAMSLMAREGLRANKLTNTWVPFVVGATAKLSDGGRLAMVLPAELLQVSYAAQLRSYLASRFSSLEMFSCNELFFDRAEQEVVLFLADGKRNVPSEDRGCIIHLSETDSLASLVATAPGRRSQARDRKILDHGSEKWLKYFLSLSEVSFLRDLQENKSLVPLAFHGSIDVGVVTGKNSFFVVSEAQVKEFGLREWTIPIVGRSAQLRGACLQEWELREFAREGQRVFLLAIDPAANGGISKSVRGYIRRGEREGIHRGYKCSIRDVWYAAPSVWRPQGFFFRQIYDFPRVVLNETKATSTDTIHRLRCRCEPRKLISNLYTHLTAALAEVEGRSYGGGVLELEPTEAERLRVPRNLCQAMPLEDVDPLVRAGKLARVLKENDRRVLMDGVGLSARDCSLLEKIWAKMRNRRMARPNGGSG